MKVAGSFSGRWTSFFATTYSIELEFFDEYLFRRLGEPPLNATVLTDAGTHATALDQRRRPDTATQTREPRLPAAACAVRALAPFTPRPTCSETPARASCSSAPAISP